MIALVGLARVFGFASEARLEDGDAAARLAGEALAGFRPADAALDARGRAALVRADDGRVALVRALGDRFVVRRLDGAAVARDGDRLTVKLPEAMFGVVALELPGAPAWVRAL